MGLFDVDVELLPDPPGDGAGAAQTPKILNLTFCFFQMAVPYDITFFLKAKKTVHAVEDIMAAKGCF
jgi:hypothetical protein